MADVSRTEIQDILDEIIKYIRGNRNHFAHQLYQEMHRSDCLGQYGHLYGYSENWDIEIKLHRKTKSKK